MSTYKILIVGIGGVGGYYGGQLARNYQNSTDVNVYFVARGPHLNEIQEHGLQVKSAHGDFNAKPTEATDNPALLGTMDLILLATKSYDLENSLELIDGNIGQKTIIIPLLNGVDMSDRAKNICKVGQVIDGLVYVTSYISKPGEVTQYGTYDKLLFGYDGQPDEQLLQVQTIMKDAGIKAFAVDDIKPQIWEKYMLISSIASITSYRNKKIGEIREEPESMSMLENVMKEVYALANKKGIPIQDDLVEKSLRKVEAFNYDAKSSMQLDFEKGKRSEVETLTGYIYKESGNYDLEAPTAKKIYEALMKIETN